MSKHFFSRAMPWDSLGLLAVLLILVIFFSMLSQYFFSALTLKTLANQIPALTVIAVGMTYVLIVAGIDLSVGSVMALCAAVMGVLISDFQTPLLIALAIALLVGALCGFANGFISAFWAIPSFVVTLGMLEIARGGAYLVTGSETKYLGHQVAVIGDSLPIIGVSLSLLIAVFVVVLAQFVLSKTVFGRYMIAIGTNEEAVRLSGINPVFWKVIVFVIAGVLAGLGGIFNSAICSLLIPIRALVWSFLLSLRW